MLQKMKSYTAIACALGVVACSAVNMEEHYFANNDAFLDQLARQYKKLADAQKARYDWQDAELFTQKALRAAHGIHEAPEHPEDWNLRLTVLPELKKARQELLDRVTSAHKDAVPQDAANAFFLYDCWVEQESRWWDEYEQTCKQEFMEVMNTLSVAKVGKKSSKPASMTHKKKAKKPPMAKAVPVEAVETSNTPVTIKQAIEQPIKQKQKMADLESYKDEDRYVLYFAFDRFILDDDAARISEDVATRLKAKTYDTVTINGHTDRAGPQAYNLKLSRARAREVRDALEELGVDISNISIFGFGESDPVNLTEDGLRDPKNRRVEIFIQ